VFGVTILSKGVGVLGVEIEPTINRETSFEPNAISLAPSSSKPATIRSTFTFKTSMSATFYLNLDYGQTKKLLCIKCNLMNSQIRVVKHKNFSIETSKGFSKHNELLKL
jgi:hypothetical protein